MPVAAGSGPPLVPRMIPSSVLPPGLFSASLRPFARSGIHPELRWLGLECGHVGVRLLAYLGGLVVLAVIAADLLIQSPSPASIQAPDQNRWLSAARPYPAFSVPMSELGDRAAAYDIFRHAEGGGRRDVLTWAGTDADRPVARIEIYRPGSERGSFGQAAATLADSAGLASEDAVQPAGMIDTKFGRVPLFAFATPRSGGQSCLGFLQISRSPPLQMSGWFCPQDSQINARTLAACALDRLTMLSSGNDARIAALFARAELQRGLCDSTGAPKVAAAADWITALNRPQLRGGF